MSIGATRNENGDIISPLTLLLGGVRAGKSGRAVALAHARSVSGRVLFVATAQALDDEMAKRITAHRLERPPEWETLESPLHLAHDIQRYLESEAHEPEVIVIDCLTLWVSNLLLSRENEPDGMQDAERVVTAELSTLLALCARHRVPSWIFVSNEVGLGVVPPTVLGRRYRDALGRANQLVASAATEVMLMVAGLELRLK